MKTIGRKHRIGHLFFKHVQGTNLEKSDFNSSLKLAHELKGRGLIDLFNEAGETVESVKHASWYRYNKTLTNKELETMLLKGAA
jgi:hypothetical protein